MLLKKRILCLFLCVLLSIISVSHSFTSPVWADTPTPTPSPTPTIDPSVTPTPTPADNSQQANDLRGKISDLQGKINNLQGQEKTLSSQIGVMDSQMKLTEYKIEEAKQEILSLEEDIDTTQKKVASLESSLADLTKVLLNRIVANYEVGGQDGVQVLIASNNVDDFFKKSNYLKIVENHDQHLLLDTIQAKNDYANQKDIFEGKKKKIVSLQTDLESYTKDLENQKSQKQSLLAETQGSESNYQKQLLQARAQLAGFSKFVASQGGASLLGNQTVCDDWGCYYNQRDSQWGGTALNNTQYSIASDGCLMTSMAMVYTHYSHKSVTPLTINSNPNNFASYEPAWLSKTIVADGASSTRVSSAIDGQLSSGNPVIVGISYDGGPLPDHFVVLISGSGGNYQMNDPFTPGGHNIAFSSHYSVGSIVEIDRVSIN